MLAADDILVSLIGNRVALTLDPMGVEITNLRTAYNPASGVLTITAATAGKISTTAPIGGISVDTKADTISVNLKTLANFAGVSVVGGAGTDSVTIGSGGVNLAGVIRGAVAQGVSINTGAGTNDTIAITGRIVAKGAGAVNLVTQGQPGIHGILLAASTTAPLGSQTFTGAVTLLGDVAIRAGGDISFSSTIDGAGKLHLASGRAIALAGDVGSTTPLTGLTLARAGRVTISQGLSLDGSGTAVGTSGLVIGPNVHNVVFSTIANARTISGFSGAGIRFVGGSQGSRITGVTSTGNGVGIQIGSGDYARTVIFGNSFSGNSSAGMSLVAARGVTIGGSAVGSGNSIVSNGRFGVTVAGACFGSLVVGNEIGDNPLGQIENSLNSRLVGTTVTQNATGLRFQLTAVGRASYLAQKARTYAFDVTFNAFDVSARSTGRLDTRTASFTSDASIGFGTVPPQSTPAVLPNRVATGLTPLKTLPGIAFPKSVLFVGSEASGKHYRAVVGLSTFVGILPLADLENVPITTRDDSPVAVDVWVNSQGYVSRVAGSFDGGSFTVSLHGYGMTALADGIGAASGWSQSTYETPLFTGGGLGPSLAPAAPVVTPSLPRASVASAAADPLLPGAGNGVTGVQVGHATLSIPVGIGYEAPADWYFPTQADGTVQARGVIWLQHALGTTGGAYSELASQLARQTNSIVVAPTLPSIPPSNSGGWSLPGDPMQAAVASLFVGDRLALNAAARAAGYVGQGGALPDAFVLAGHSAGGGFATSVGALTVDNGAASNLLGVIMYDGVSTGAFDGSGGFAKELAELGTRDIPIYQIAAPAQLWNAYGATTNALMAALPGQFNGVVLVGGSHVDAMLGGDPRVDFVAQRVTKVSLPGNAAAIPALSAGWINDLYVGATSDAPQYGFYASANQAIMMGDTAAALLPSPIANTLSLGDKRLVAEIDAIGGLQGFLPGPATNTGTNGIVAAVTPPQTNGVTGVKTGTASLDIPCGNNGYVTTADWYFPTQADGRVAANGVVWLQRGELGDASSFAMLATEIARQTNSIVMAPKISSFETAALPGGFLGSAALREGVASMFVGDRGALNISASAAGNQGPLPQKFLLAGLAAGGGFATSVGGYAVDNGAASNLFGVVMVDGFADEGQFTESLAKCDSLGILVYQIASPPDASNAWGRTTDLLSVLHPGQFVGIETPLGAKDAVITASVGWINDIFAGYGPTSPLYGIYGNPNDGTYVLGQSITMGLVKATVL